MVSTSKSARRRPPGRPLAHMPGGAIIFPLLGVVYLCFSFLIYGSGEGPLAGYFPDNDNTQRLHQVLQFLTHGEWFTTRSWQTVAPEGLQLHWTRLPDILIALLALPFIGALGMEQALYISAFLTPPVLMGLFIHLTARTLQHMNGGTPKHSNSFHVTLAVLISLPLLLYGFMPGRVDHHVYAAFGQMALLAGLAAGLRENLAERQRQNAVLGYSFLAGITLGATLEGFPALLASLAAPAVAWALRGQTRWLTLAVELTGGVLMGAIVALCLISPPPELLAIVYDRLSVIYPLVLAGGGLVLFCISRLPLAPGGGLRPARTRFLVLLVASGALAALLLAAFPGLPNPHWHAASPLLQEITRDYILEARPLLENAQMPRLIMINTFLPALMLGLALFRLWRERQRPRALLWAVCAGGMAVYLGLCLFWQLRFILGLSIFAVLPLGWILQRLWRPQRRPGGRRIARRAGALALLLSVLPVAGGTIWGVVFYPGLYISRPAASCDDRQLALNLLSHPLLRDPQTRIATLDLNAAKLSFLIPQRFMALGVFHREGQNAEDYFRMLQASSAAQALDILDAYGIQLITLCQPQGMDAQGVDIKTDVKPHTWQAFLGQGWVAELYKGNIPDGLRRIPADLAPGWLILERDRTSHGTGKESARPEHQ